MKVMKIKGEEEMKGEKKAGLMALVVLDCEIHFTRYDEGKEFVQGVLQPDEVPSALAGIKKLILSET